jgi:hypothetical protein
MARYEVAVVSERIKSGMNDLEDVVRGYFERSLTSSDAARLMDATCLLQYATVARLRGSLALPVDELRNVRVGLQLRAKELFAAASSPTQKCFALDLSAFAQLAPEPGSETPPNLDPVFADWNEIVKLVDQAPLFPVTELADRLTQWVTFLVDHPSYEALMERLDEAVGRRTGRFAVANNCANRARQLSKAKRLVQAIRELNRAKIDWFAAETLPLALGCLMLASRHYSSLGLVYASKYYALATSYLALPSDDTTVKWLIARGLFMAADCDYEAGSWLQAISLLRSAQVAQSHYVGKDLGNDDEDRHRLLLYGSIIYAIGQKQGAELRGRVEQLTADWPDLDVLQESVAKAEETFLAQCSPGGAAPTGFFRGPFSECGAVQAFVWTALGITWRVTWATHPELNLAAEQFIAVAQIVACDLARTDLYVIPSQVHIELELDPARSSVEIERLPSNKGSTWKLYVPAGQHTPQRHAEDVAAVIAVLHEQSLRPEQWPVMTALGSEGLFQNTMVGNLYSSVYSAINPIPSLEQPAQADARFEGISWRTLTHHDLGWNEAIVEEYDASRVPELLARRYEVGLKTSRLTLPRLLADAGVRSTLLALRADGWLDWQILSAISAIATAWRVAEKGMQLFQPDGVRLANEFMSNEERAEWAPVPLEEFTPEHLRMQLDANLLSTFRMMGLSSRQQTPDFGALREFAKVKLRYFKDDLPHNDPFNTDATGGTP